MIERMKQVSVVSSLSRKEEMLKGLKTLGILHLSEKKSPKNEIAEAYAALLKTLTALEEYAPDKKTLKALKAKDAPPLLQGADFDDYYCKVNTALDQKNSLIRENAEIRAEIERITPWGEMNPEDLAFLKDHGVDLRFYTLTKGDFKALLQDETIQTIVLRPVAKQIAVAALGPLPDTFAANVFQPSRKSIAEWEGEAEENRQKIAECDAFLKAAALYTESFKAEMHRLGNVVNDSAAEETAESNDAFIWLRGYIPEKDIEGFKTAAAQNAWAYAIDDVQEEDEQVPTAVRYNKLSKLIKPVFDILGILPGYRETDIALWFFLFFTLFFAMIIGDGGYGALMLIGTIVFSIKTKKRNTVTYLLTVLSVATIIWGAITGTWFGLESAMKVPLLKALVIPNFANYPAYFGVTALEQQNTIMKFSFSVGAVQMALGSLLAIKKKLAEKNLSWVADLGWMIAVIAMYLLSLYLVINENIPILPVFISIGVSFLLVVLFGGMSPDKTFGQGLKAGLTDAFTVFLNTISCFGNVMSYIRLFAVGMAGLAISQSFNQIAAGFSGPLVIAGIAVVLIGHALNIVMCFLSVVVHGVRLNVLEFSGQVGLEWTGIAYDPYREEQKQHE